MEKLKTHIGQMLKKHVKENRVSQAAWARRQGVTQQKVWLYLKREKMRVDTLFNICHSLKYNFLREIADELPAEFPSKTPAAFAQRISELEEENKMLKREIEIWKEAVGVRK